MSKPKFPIVVRQGSVVVNIIFIYHNRTIARLDDAFQTSKRFVADASHDLRTPLTILPGGLDGSDISISSNGRRATATSAFDFLQVATSLTESLLMFLFFSA